jgi:hypothetical protein
VLAHGGVRGPRAEHESKREPADIPGVVQPTHVYPGSEEAGNRASVLVAHASVRVGPQPAVGEGDRRLDLERPERRFVQPALEQMALGEVGQPLERVRLDQLGARGAGQLEGVPDVFAAHSLVA